MNQRLKYQRVVSLFLAVLMVAVLIVPSALTVSAANKHFISELRVEKGDGALTELEEQGWSVMMTGLNATTDPASQVYLLYKVDTGSPITDVVVSPDVGESFTGTNGIIYKCVSHVDLDDGIGGGAGCLYATTDAKAGSSIVAFDVLRSNKENKETLYPITNDGAEVVATSKGTPADIEASSKTDIIYLAMIRDGLVKPYIREIGIITDKDKWNAVYTAFERGFTYYVEGDIDNSSDTYTIIGYERTADPSDAVTNIIAITAQTTFTSGDSQAAVNAGNINSATLSISDIKYSRTSSVPIKAGESFYLYRTKDTKAGNPISMIYAETYVQNQNFLFGMWANGYFFSNGSTTANSYCMNEDIYVTLREDKTVCTKLPVQILDDLTAVKSTSTGAPGDDTTTAESAAPESPAEQPSVEQPSAEQPSVEQPSAEQPSAEQPSAEQPSVEQPSAEQPSVAEPATESSVTEVSAAESSAAPEQSVAESTVEEAQAVESSAAEESSAQEQSAPGNTEKAKTARYIDLTMLTPRDGLPAATASLTGMRGDPDAPYVERTERSDRINKLQASVFGEFNIITPILVVVVVVAAVSYYIYRKSQKEKEAVGPKKTKMQNKTSKQIKPDNTKKQNIKNSSKKSKKSKRKR